MFSSRLQLLHTSFAMQWLHPCGILYPLTSGFASLSQFLNSILKHIFAHQSTHQHRHPRVFRLHCAEIHTCYCPNHLVFLLPRCCCDAGLRRGTLSERRRLLGWREKPGFHGDDNDTRRHVHTWLHVLLGENVAQPSGTRSQRTGEHCGGRHRVGTRLRCTYVGRSRRSVVTVFLL